MTAGVEGSGRPVRGGWELEKKREDWPVGIGVSPGATLLHSAKQVFGWRHQVSLVAVVLPALIQNPSPESSGREWVGGLRLSAEPPLPVSTVVWSPPVAAALVPRRAQRNSLTQDTIRTRR